MKKLIEVLQFILQFMKDPDCEYPTACEHEYEFEQYVIGADWYCRGQRLPLYRCCKCGHERIGR